MSEQFQLLFLPKYSPQLNVAEYLFSTIKARIKSMVPRPQTRGALKLAIRHTIEVLQDDSVIPYYGEVRQWIQRGYNRENF
jgi:transposase